MQIEKRKLYSLFLILCLMASVIRFDDFKSDMTMSFSDATKDATPSFSAQSCVFNNDACTSELLGGVNTLLLNQQVSIHKNESLKKSEVLFWLKDLAAIQPPFTFVTSVTSTISSICSNGIKIIHFIHDKDGKKKL